MYDHTTEKIAHELRLLLDQYSSFALEFAPFSSLTDTAQYMLFTRSVNAFRSAGILAWEGLFVDSYNSVRVGLECGWLALILRNSEERAKEWLTLVPSDTSVDDIEKKYRNTYGKVFWIRQEVSLNRADLEQRTNIYQLLSTKSHANPASTFYVADSEIKPNDLCLYPPHQFDSNEHRVKYIKTIQYCLKYMLWDIQLRSEQNFGVNWSYNKESLFNISGVAYPDEKQGFVVVPNKVNAAYQAMILLKFADVEARKNQD